MVPKFQPEQWIVSTHGGAEYLGKVIGARYFTPTNDKSGPAWHYTIQYGLDNVMHVRESEITHYIANGDYVAVNR